MPYGVLSSISLEPYSPNDMIVCSGYSAQELHDWLQDVYVGDWYGSDIIPTLGAIKKHAIAKQNILTMIREQESSIDALNNEAAAVGGCLFYDKEKNIYLMVLRAGFNPYSPEDMINTAHEVLHMCQVFLPTYFDRTLEMENEAYFHSNMMRQIYKKFIS
jgi:hypothetical protein